MASRSSETSTSSQSIQGRTMFLLQTGAFAPGLSKVQDFNSWSTINNNLKRLTLLPLSSKVLITPEIVRRTKEGCVELMDANCTIIKFFTEIQNRASLLDSRLMTRWNLPNLHHMSWKKSKILSKFLKMEQSPFKLSSAMFYLERWGLCQRK
jgi:hypothetical protein